jgi:monoamine oxidase
VQDPITATPIELGAEFVHGRPPEIWDIASKEAISLTEVSGEDWSASGGKLRRADVFSDVDEILSRMSDREPDRSFGEFLATCCPQAKDEAKRRALAYVTGFHAADPDKVSVHSLVRSSLADEKINGDQAFRLQGGYQSLLNVFREALARAGVKTHLNTVVQSVASRKGAVEISALQSGSPITFAARRVLVTLPLGVLQLAPECGGVRFIPDLPSPKRRALQKLEMGKVVRLTLCFEKRFWDDMSPGPEQQETLRDMRFLFSQEKLFPTWWTTLPNRHPMLVAWAPFHAAEALAGKNQSFLVSTAHEVLARLLQLDERQLASLHRTAYWHDWGSDPFSKGAYSYVKVGGDRAQADLAAPIDNTLFFAGEATDVSGHNGTVHGAIASGRRAAQEILDSRA